MRARAGTYNFSRKVLKPKIFSSGENNFYTVHFFIYNYDLSNLDVILFFIYMFSNIWDYKHANAENIQKAISMFDWHKAFKNKNTHEMTWVLTDTLLNIFKNVIPHKTKKFDYKYPKWMNSFIISSLKKRTLKDFIKIPQIMMKIY